MKELCDAVEEAARVIKIGIGAQEIKSLAGDLTAFLRWLEPVLAVDTAESEPLLYSRRGANTFREDEPQAGDVDTLQRVSESFEDGFYRVPTIIE